MSKEKKVEGLTSMARSAIASAIANAIATNESSGSLVTQACNVAHKYAKGAEIGEDDRKAIVLDIAKARGWKGDAIKVRGSEVGTILKTYDKLPDAEAAYRKASGGVCQWHSVLKMARRIIKGDSINKAVAFAKAKGDGGAGNPAGRLAGALSAMFDGTRGDKRAAVVSAMRKLTEAGVLKLTGKTAEKFANA